MRRNVVVAAIPVILALAVGTVGISAAPARSNEGRRVIHHTAVVAQQFFTGDPNNPQLGDQFIVNVDLFDDSHAKVGHSGSSCTVVGVPPRDTEVQCLADIVLAQGKITFGGLAPFPPTTTPVQFSVLGGTGDFRKARGTFVVFAVNPNTFDGTLHLLG
jgi:hypothetical protein